MQKNILRVGFDLDDTIANHERARSYLLSQFPQEKIKSNSFTRSEIETFQENLYGTHLSLEASVMENAHDVLQTLSYEDGVELFIISRRMSDHSRNLALEWIGMHILEIPKEHIYFVDNDSQKGMLCEKLGIQLFLDNRENVLTHLPPSVTGVFFNPEDGDQDSSFNKVKNWQEFYQFYQDFKNSREIFSTSSSEQ